jgi:hypothetical protein
MIWYGIEPIVSKDEAAAIQILEQTRIPKIRRFIAERLSLRMALTGLFKVLSDSSDPLADADMVQGMLSALNGRRDVPPPEGWGDVSRRLRQASLEEGAR